MDTSSMVDRWDVCVIGGGVIGLSVARELARAGVERVVVAEREAAVGQGSSEQANGGFRAQFTTAINISFSLYSIGELEKLDESSRGEVGLHQTGYLLLTGTETGEDTLRAGYELQRSLGVATELLFPADVPARAALVRTSGLRVATFHQRDGFLDPHGVVAALKEDAQARGARIATRRAVRDIERHGNEFLVQTDADDLVASWVVNAAGSHARVVAEMLGIDIPVAPVRRNLAFIPDPDGGELIPMCVDLDTGVLVRREAGGGYVIAYSDPGDVPGWDTTLDPLFLGQVAERIGNRFPSLATIPIDPRHCWAGLYPETPDHHAIVGPSPGHDHFVQCVGFGGHGIMHSPAAGKAVAEIITNGRCTTFDLHPLRVERFAEGDLVVETAVL